MRHAKRKSGKNLFISKTHTGKLLQMCESSSVLAMLRCFFLECSIVFKSVGLEACFLCEVCCKVKTISLTIAETWESRMC